MRTRAVVALLTMLGVMVTSATLPAQTQGPYDPNADAHRDIEAALRDARADDKLVLLDFGANWCLDCIVLDRLLQDQMVESFFKANFHVAHIDVGEWDRNLDISEQYDRPIDNGIPAVVVLSPKGDVIASTRDGALADARTATPQQILRYLQAWVSARHR